MGGRFGSPCWSGRSHAPAPEAQPLLAAFLPHFTHPTDARLVALTAAAILTAGRRTVANALRTVGDLAPGNDASYRRVLSAAEWSGLALGCGPARFPLGRPVPAGPVDLAGDDTADGHPGRTAYGKGRHRGPVRSSRAYTAWRYGHRWVVPAVLAKFPLATQRWALPVLADLYRTPEVSKAEKARHETPAPLMCRLLRVVPLRPPGRTLALAGDSGFGAHEVGRFCHRHRRPLTLVGKPHPDVNLFAPPPPYRGNGRPRVKGDCLPEPRAAAATSRRRKLTAGWYGGGARRARAATGTGHWDKGGDRPVPIRWVFVRDATGTHRGEYLFTSGTARTADVVAGTYCGRGSIETPFPGCRSCTGLETTRGRCRGTVCRAAPCPFGLYPVVAVLSHLSPGGERTGGQNRHIATNDRIPSHLSPGGERTGGVVWPGKATVTFSDALTAVRRRVRVGGVFPRAGADAATAEPPANVRELLLTGLAPAR